MKNKLTLITCLMLLAFSLFAGSGGHKRKVLVIGIDGCRSDALQLANTPSIDSLVAHGFYTYDSWHCDISISGPSWSSIMCGVYHWKHGVTNNSYTGSNYNRYPYFPTLAKQIDSTFKCVQYTEWNPMSSDVYNDGWDQKIVGTDGYSQGTGTAAVALIADPKTDVLFTYFDHVDLTGHASGFSPTNPSYIQAIEEVDVQVGNIINAMRARPTYNQEDWLVLLITDHGGIGTGHGGVSYEERHIWWIGYSERGIHLRASGPQDTVTLNNPPDPGFYYVDQNGVDTAKQHLSPVQADIAVTALHHLIYDSGKRPERDTTWNLDGRSWLCEMGLCSDKHVGINNIGVMAPELKIGVAPNPSNNGLFTIYSESLDNKDVQYTVTDMAGRVVNTGVFAITSIKHQLDLSNLSKGVYHLVAKSGEQTAVKTLSIQ